MGTLSIPEILESLEDKSSSDRIRILKYNDTKSLRQILYIAFSQNCEFVLYQQTRKLKIFMKNTGYDHLSNSKREMLFFQILESVDSSEAELLLQLCVDRKLKTSLTYQDVFEAYENLLPKKEHPVVEEVPEEKETYKNLQELYEEKMTPEEEEKETYKNLQELYEEKLPKKGKNKKSSKKKTK